MLFRHPLRDNITLFDETVGDSAVLEALAELGLEAWVESLGDGLDTELAGGGAQISAGEGAARRHGPLLS